MRAFTLGNIPKPEFNAEILNANKPLDLEIGAGQGLHAIHYAQKNPHRILIAVERTHTRFSRLEQRQKNHPEIQNLIAVHADAEALIIHHIPDNSLENIFLLYPNPNPKPKHANLRWHNQPFMKVLLNKLKPNGKLTLATNLEWYAQEAAKTFTQIWSLKLVEHTQVNPTHAPRTHFEKKYLARGEICWNLQFRKVQ